MSSSKKRDVEMELFVIQNQNKSSESPVSKDYNVFKSFRPVVEYINAEQHSYEEIAGIVSNKDDLNMLCLTLRSWTIGILFAILISTVNQYFEYRTKTYSFSASLVLLLAYPI
ncbi:unnamed protein product, partial [Didymodactylos carnosus]